MADRDKISSREGFDEKKVKVHISANEGTGELPKVSDDLFRAAGWSDDPGVGKAYLLEDGREVVNPIPMAPPIGYEPLPTLMELMDKMVRKHLVGLKDSEIIDETEEDASDFDVEDDTPDPLSIYELVDMVAEHPALPKEPEASEVPAVAGATPQPPPAAPAE